MNLRRLLPLLVLLWSTSPRRLVAQWSTENLPLVAGWNAVYLHVDVTNVPLDSLVGSDLSNPIQEVWQWVPASPTAQFVKDPATPVGTSTHWLSWNRNGAPSSGLQYLTGNAAYLVRTTTDFRWSLTGRPVAPRYLWTGTGLNLIGFPTPTNQPPTFDVFLSPVPIFAANATIFWYPGGPLGAANPSQVFDQTARAVQRGQAFWISSPQFNNYFGPVTVDLGSATRIDFGPDQGQYSFRLRNQTVSNLTVNLTLLPSDSAPAGQAPVVGTPPLLLRGPLNPTNLTYGFTTLDQPAALTLAPMGQPGSDLQVILGLNRANMGSYHPGDEVSGVLRVTDALNFSQIDVPVSAEVGSTTGLWVGNALISNVRQYLTQYVTATNQQNLSNILAQLNLTNTGSTTYVIDPDTSRVIQQQQVVVGIETNLTLTYLTQDASSTNTSVPSPYPLRLIIHNGDTNGVTLLQRVYLGNDVSSNAIVAIRQDLLDPNQLSTARRISSVHLPWNPDAQNTGWPGTGGGLVEGSNLAFSVPLAMDNFASNPFLHTYHPDHDNLDAQYQSPAPPGTESYAISRSISLQFNPPGNDFNGLTGLSTRLAGYYHETLTVTGATNQSRSFDIGGSFQLNRISPIPILTKN